MLEKGILELEVLTEEVMHIEIMDPDSLGAEAERVSFLPEEQALDRDNRYCKSNFPQARTRFGVLLWLHPHPQ